MAHVAPAARRRPGQDRRHNPLAAPLLLFAAVTVVAAVYVAYVLWPRWPQAQVALDAPAVPIIVAGVTFNIEPAAIRRPVQRRPGVQERVDLSYLWPSLIPPDPAAKPTVGAPVDPNERLFVTIASGAESLPAIERVNTIYQRYLAEIATRPDGLSARAFRDGSPYQGEDLIFDPTAPEHFLARCSRQGVGNTGICMLERRIGTADVTVRFPREWLSDWRNIAQGIDTLVARMHPYPKPS